MIFNTLPEDKFGVYVQNEIDARRLLWLANKIGEKKLRLSANKRNPYYPDSKLFVSVLLKRFNLKVLVEIYNAINIPIYRVYILVLHDHSKLKVGITGNWPHRAYAFVKTANYRKNFDGELKNFFDLHQSMAFPAGTKHNALRIESVAKKLCSPHKVPSPARYCCGGHHEWFDYSIYPNLVKYFSVGGAAVTLASSITWQQSIQSIGGDEKQG